MTGNDGTHYLFSSGKVITVDSRFTIAEAVLVANGRILAVGKLDDVSSQAPTGTRAIDLGGRTLMPGFIDTHGHVALFGLDELKVQLRGARSKAEILDRLRAAVVNAQKGAWVVSMPIGDPPYFLNADELRRNGEIPSLAELDAIASDNPIYVQAPTNRVPNFALLNSAAMHAAGINASTDVSELTNIGLDAHGIPTGVIEGAMQPIYNFDPLYQLVEQAAPRPSYSDVCDGIAILAPQFARSGTTTLLEAHLTNPEELRAYAELLDAGRLPLRVFYTFEIDFTRSLDEIAEFLRTVRFAANGGFGTAQLKVCGVSIGLDGPYWHGAAVNDQPYLGPFGDVVAPEPLVPWPHYRAILDLASQMNFRIHAEGAGRGSIAIVLKAFAEIDEQIPIRDKRYVLEHCEFPTRDQIAECARLGVAPTTSTNFIWGKGAEVYRERLGPDYCASAIPMRDWFDAGVPIAQSTDWGPHEALFTLWQSLARQAGLTGEVIGPEQRITREEAIRAFTINGAWALKSEREIGSIETGKRADLVVLSDDPLTCAEDDIRHIDVDLTMVDGHIVHET